MKEIKAYIRTSRLDDTVNALKDAGAPGITIVTVHPVGYGFGTRFAMSEIDISKRCYDISRIEMVCDAEELETFIDVILEFAHTGARGDGHIFVSDISEAIRIRTRSRGSKIAVLE
jgi:nitrogen regulatory protein P-II 1